MKKIILAFIVGIMLVPTNMRAGEGMWFLMFIERLNQRDMEKDGLQLTADEIYSINHSSLKDAIVQFNGNCTGEIVSKDGLVLTNHHCGYDAVAELSTAEDNILKNGFWAKDRAAERHPESGLFVRFFVRMDDVSKRILAKVNPSMTEAEREKAVNAEIALIEKENNEGGKYTVSVKSFFQGNEYYYFVYQDYKDVRLVGVPTESIGKFGGDTDNWIWPRHTGDFSMFRVYADKNGNPAPYSENNVPLKPKQYLPISLNGVKENDFAMILGYPGTTNRWMPAGGIEQNVKFGYPAWVEASKVGMDNMKKYMDQSDALNLVYASKYATVANYWKNRQGMIDALSKFGTAKTKAAQEAKFDKWANKPANKAKYGNVVANINKYYGMTNEKSRHDNYLQRMFRISASANVAKTLGKKLDAYTKADVAKRAEMKADVSETAKKYFEDTYLPAEKDILAAQLDLYAAKAKGYPLSPLVTKLDKENNGKGFKDYVNATLDLSMFSSLDRVKAFIEYPSQGVLDNDPLYVLSTDLNTHLASKSDEIAKAKNDFDASFRLLVEGLRESKIGDIKYPDANSTLRLTYGKVRALPADKRNDAKINNYTTLAGQVKKYKKGDEEFDLPVKVLEMNKNKEYGRYADKDGSLHVNFLTDNDITGGNSGSPVLNGKGELIGIAFDGNIEAMAGDVIFDKNLQRTINVDIRYVLWIIENLSGAKHIVDEMTIAK
ncbi:MAG: S46 family peptidase [Phycisphaerales bacterium]